MLRRTHKTIISATSAASFVVRTLIPWPTRSPTAIRPRWGVWGKSSVSMFWLLVDHLHLTTGCFVYCSVQTARFECSSQSLQSLLSCQVKPTADTAIPESRLQTKIFSPAWPTDLIWNQMTMAALVDYTNLLENKVAIMEPSVVWFICQCERYFFVFFVLHRPRATFGPAPGWDAISWGIWAPNVNMVTIIVTSATIIHWMVQEFCPVFPVKRLGIPPTIGRLRFPVFYFH